MMRVLASHGSPPSALTVRRMKTRPMANRATAMSRVRIGWEEGGCPLGMKACRPARSGLPRRVLYHGQLVER